MAKEKTIGWKEASKIDYSYNVDGTQSEFPGHERIQSACLQRIATAAEAMAINIVRLQNDYEGMKRNRDQWEDLARKLEHKVRGLKGAITRLKKNQK